MPDFFRGSPALQPWSFLSERLGQALGGIPMLYRLKVLHGKATVIDRDTERAVVPFLRACGVETLACVGFCFGGEPS